jgi:hypothetical protein
VSDPIASWKVQKTIKAPVQVYGIEDPLFAHEYYTHNVTKTRMFTQSKEIFYNFTNTTFTNYYLSEEYIILRGGMAGNTPDSRSSTAAGRSVLQRYRGDLDNNGSTCCGIESIVNSQYLDSKVINNASIVNWSFVDYNFFLRQNPQYNFHCGTSAIFSLNSSIFPDHYMRLDNYHAMKVYRMNTTAMQNWTCTP